jgi:saccharopine dehydrogenase-like NADP-dependent oxidoreductase
MREKTLRYPGHADKIRILSESGFFDETPRAIEGQMISPRDFTSALLFEEWKLEPGEEEVTVMRIIVEGMEDGKKTIYQYDLFDAFDKRSGVSSMSRTTGYTATAMVNLLLDGKFKQKGVFPPEIVGGRDGCFEYILDYLKKRNIEYKMQKQIM